jgi:hypothetical protein
MINYYYALQIDRLLSGSLRLFTGATRRFRCGGVITNWVVHGRLFRLHGVGLALLLEGAQDPCQYLQAERLNMRV